MSFKVEKIVKRRASEAILSMRFVRSPAAGGSFIIKRTGLKPAYGTHMEVIREAQGLREGALWPGWRKICWAGEASCVK